MKRPARFRLNLSRVLAPWLRCALAWQGWRWLGLGAVLLLGLGAIAGGPWAGPLIGRGDTDLWDAMGYELGQRWGWWPWPHLNLSTNDWFYPLGTSIALQAWGIERDGFNAILQAWLGYGPWLQIYYVMSVAIAAAGTAVLLWREVGRDRALVAAAIVGLFNFYGAVGKYPYHLNMAIVHWTVLGIVADFVMVRRVANHDHLGTPWFLGRAVLVVLSLGQDLGYVAGFGLLSLTLSLTWIVLMTWLRAAQLARRSLRQEDLVQAFLAEEFPDDPDLEAEALSPLERKVPPALRPLWRLYPVRWLRRTVRILWVQSQTQARHWWEDVQAGQGWGWGVGGLLILGAIATYLYVPVVLQIYRSAQAFDFSEVYGRDWYSHPLRLLIPYLPGWNPVDQATQWQRWFPSALETDLDGAVGWFVVGWAALGVWQRRRRWPGMVPLGLLLLLCLAYRPLDVPTLQVFPWFSFNRVGGRCTVIYPVVLALLGTGVEPNRWPWRRAGIVALALLASLELWGGYGLVRSRPPSDAVVAMSPDFWDYMATVRSLPGEALLDWPFCAIGGNGVGINEGLCPYAGTDPSLHALRRFHGKKVMGGYLGRLHPSQIEAYQHQGWGQLFRPDPPDPGRSRQQQRCFYQDEWDFFQTFFDPPATPDPAIANLGLRTDFAALQLHLDRLPAGCAEEFFHRWGPAIATTTLPSGGRVALIPRPSSPTPPPAKPAPAPIPNPAQPWDAPPLIPPPAPRFAPDLSPTAPPDPLRSPLMMTWPRDHFDPPFDPHDGDLLANTVIRGVTTQGLDRIRTGPSGQPQRWGYGPATILEIALPPNWNRPLALHMGVLPALADQAIALELDGQTLTTLPLPLTDPSPPDPALPPDPSSSPTTAILPLGSLSGGPHTLTLRYRDWLRDAYRRDRPWGNRPIAVTFTTLTLTSDPATPSP